jgi:phage N-6-adenine-methyltransferase
LNKQATDLMFSSTTDLWATPQEFFDRLAQEFNFTLDPCSDGTNNKCDRYFTAEEDGLAQDWSGHTVFMNPPYGKVLRDWIKKAYESAQEENTVVVALIPSRTETRYWHEYVMKAKEIRFVKGRIKFGDAKYNAPFPSAVVIFDGNNTPNIGVINAN